MHILRCFFVFFIFALFCGCASTVPQVEYLKVQKELETCKENAAYYESIFQCISLMHVGDYEKAENYCRIAGDIHPEDEKYQMIIQMFEQEKASFSEAVMRTK
ncbi:MAG: hypothetical protein J6S69_03695 [Proteobacteria bacterium]|nr:hypothetical protein [Pseudomonadota bacterium]